MAWTYISFFGFVVCPYHSIRGKINILYRTPMHLHTSIKSTRLYFLILDTHACISDLVWRVKETNLSVTGFWISRWVGWVRPCTTSVTQHAKTWVTLYLIVLTHDQIWSFRGRAAFFGIPSTRWRHTHLLFEAIYLPGGRVSIRYSNSRIDL